MFRQNILIEVDDNSNFYNEMKQFQNGFRMITFLYVHKVVRK